MQWHAKTSIDARDKALAIDTEVVRELFSQKIAADQKRLTRLPASFFPKIWCLYYC